MLQVMPMLMLGGGALLALVMVMVAFAGPSSDRASTRRLLQVRERHSGSAVAAVDAQLRRITAGRETKMDAAAGRLLPNVALLKKRLAMTGKPWSVGGYGQTTLGITVLVTALAWWRGAPVLLALLFGLAIGIGLPHFGVGHFVKRRVNKFTAKFPDAIELLVRGLRSGLPISETMGVVGAELAGPVGEEFRSVSDKMKIGRSMDAALQETADRLGTPEFQFFVISVAIQRETGGNLAETLANLATVLRSRGQMKLKIRAMSSESKASAYIVGSLPFIVFGLIWMVNSAYLSHFFTDQRLMVAGIVGLVWMGIGAGIMAKMVSFEI